MAPIPKTLAFVVLALVIVGAAAVTLVFSSLSGSTLMATGTRSTTRASSTGANSTLQLPLCSTSRFNSTAQAVPYSITFERPAGAFGWGLTVDGVHYATADPTLTLNCSNGTIAYSFDISVMAANGTRHQCTRGCSGTIPLSGTISKLHVDGNVVKDDSGNVVVLRGVAIQEYGYKASYMTRYNEFDFEYLAHQWQARVVRIPVLPAMWRANSTYLTKVLDPLVQWSNKYGMYAIIDWHGEGNIDTPGLNGNVDASLTNVAETVAFWKTVSQHYSGRAGVIYEIFNEPGSNQTWTGWWPTAQLLVDQIRQLDNSTLILVGGVGWSSDLSGAIHNPLVGKNIGYVVHPYPTTASFPSSCKANPIPCWDRTFGNAAALYPVFATEWGYVLPYQLAACPKESFATYWNGYDTTLAAYFQAKGVSWTPWNWSPDPNQSPCYSMIMSFAKFQPTPFGAYVRSQLTTLAPPPTFVRG